MNLANALDLRRLITEAVDNVFQTMLSLPIEYVSEKPMEGMVGEKVVAVVGFAGKATGVIHIHISEVFAQIITAAMLGIRLQDVEGVGQVNDAIGELGNMVAGNVKSHLCDAGWTCALTIPTITRGGDFQIASIDHAKHEQFVFRHQQQQMFVELDIKDG